VIVSGTGALAQLRGVLVATVLAPLAFHSALPPGLRGGTKREGTPRQTTPVGVRRWTTSPRIASLKEKESQLSIVEPLEDVSTEGAHETQVSKVKPGGSHRRRLSTDEGREIARLYTETNTLTSDIRARFGIGESSLYRIVQRQGIPLRGRTSSSKAQVLQPAQVQNGSRSGWSNSRQRAASAPRSTAATNTRRASVASGRAPSTGSAASQPGCARQRYRIRFQGERVVEAQDIRDALRGSGVAWSDRDYGGRPRGLTDRACSSLSGADSRPRLTLRARLLRVLYSSLIWLPTRNVPQSSPCRAWGESMVSQGGGMTHLRDRFGQTRAG
jgi:hypothetical protein